MIHNAAMYAMNDEHNRDITQIGQDKLGALARGGHRPFGGLTERA